MQRGNISFKKLPFLEAFAEKFMSKAMRYPCTGGTQISSNGRLISTPNEQKEKRKKKVKNVRLKCWRAGSRSLRHSRNRALWICSSRAICKPTSPQRLRDYKRRKRSDKFNPVNRFLHLDNAFAYSTLCVCVKFLDKHNMAAFTYPPYSPAVMQCDFLLFPKFNTV